MLSSATLSTHCAFREWMQSHANQHPSTNDSQASSLMLFRCAKALLQAGWQDLALISSPSSTSGHTRFLLRGCSDKLRRALNSQSTADQSSEAMEDTANVSLDEPEQSIESTPAAAPILLEPARLTPFQYVLPMSSHENLTQSLITSLYSTFDIDSFLLAVFSPPSMFSFFPFYRENFHVLPRSMLQKHEGEMDGENAAAAEEDALADEEDGVRNNRNNNNNNFNDSKKNQRKASRENKKQKRKQETQIQSADAKRFAVTPSFSASSNTLITQPVAPSESTPSSDLSSITLASVPSVSPAAPSAPSSHAIASNSSARRPRRTRHAE